MTASNTTRTLAKLRADGYTAAVSERWNPHAGIRQDLFGFIDVVALGDGYTLGVQACSYSGISARVRKIADHDNIAAVRKANWRIEVWGWRKVGHRWTVRVVDVS